MKDISVEIKSRNTAAIITLVTAKIVSVITIVLVFVNHTLAGVSLGLYAALLIATVVLCVKNMRSSNQQEVTDKDVIRRLKEEGVLNQYLKEVA